MSSPRTLTLKANNNAMSGFQYHIVQMGGNRTVAPATAAANMAIGVLNNAPAAYNGAACEVVVDGPCKCVLGANANNGQFIVADANSHGVGVTAGTSNTTNGSVGVALEDGVAGDIVTILVRPGFIQV